MTTLDPTRHRFGGWSATPTLPPAQRDSGEKATDFAYSYLKKLVVTLALPPLTIITENAVAEALQVSRTPVREAFMRLSAERLLEYLPRRGALVPEITLRSIREQAETRVVLEGWGIDQICAQRIPIADALYASIDAQAALAESNPTAIAEMVAIDKDFHWQLVKAAGNTEFSRLYNSLHDRQLRTGIAMFTAVQGRPKAALCQHRHIADAVREFDRDNAQRLLREHLIGSLEAVAVSHAFTA